MSRTIVAAFALVGLLVQTGAAEAAGVTGLRSCNVSPVSPSGAPTTVPASSANPAPPAPADSAQTPASPQGCIWTPAPKSHQVTSASNSKRDTNKEDPLSADLFGSTTVRPRLRYDRDYSPRRSQKSVGMSISIPN